MLFLCSVEGQKVLTAGKYKSSVHNTYVLYICILVIKSLNLRQTVQKLCKVEVWLMCIYVVVQYHFLLVQNITFIYFIAKQ